MAALALSARRRLRAFPALARRGLPRGSAVLRHGVRLDLRPGNRTIDRAIPDLAGPGAGVAGHSRLHGGAPRSRHREGPAPGRFVAVDPGDGMAVALLSLEAVPDDLTRRGLGGW